MNCIGVPRMFRCVEVYDGSGTVNRRVWMSSDSGPATAKEMSPSKHNALRAINNQFIHIMEQWNSHMQVPMDDGQMKRRGVNKSDGRWEEISC